MPIISNFGGSGTENCVAISFYDWDGETFLGSIGVEKGLPAGEIASAVSAYTATLMPPNTDMSNRNDETAKAYTVYNADYPLTSHEGYTFGKWIDFESEAYTIYGNALRLNDTFSIEEIPSPESPDFSKLEKSIRLKAAYIANDLMTAETLPNAAARSYTISNGAIKKDDGSYDYDPNDGYFDRVGSSSVYLVRAMVTRENEDNNPVYRTRQTALRVVFLTTDGMFTNSLVKLKNVDEQIAEVIVPENADSVSLTVIDIGGASDWIGVASRSSSLEVNNDDFKLQGNIVYINKYPDTFKNADGTFKTTFVVPQGVFDNLSLDISAVWTIVAEGFEYPSTAIATETGAAARRRRAIINIDYCKKQKLAETGKQYLTLTELQNAITYGNYKGEAVQA